ncbi:MFS transporter [Prauserella oleivorans]|uniref:MFS transporter n=1 Tax=Prauserella oleivorans TaxID=1478153 RepID=A0ABW5WCU0_9PSEU
MPVALFALAIGAFGIGTTEFVMMGVLPEAAADFGIDIPTAGHLISAYALGVVVGAPLLTIAALRLPRKTVLLALMGLFIGGNTLFALAPSHDFGMLFRFLAGLPHGAFFGAGAVVASSLAKPGQKAKSVSMMFMGLTLANVIGVPVGTLLGQQLGWRTTFLLVAAIGGVALVCIAKLVPHQGRPAETSLRGELGAFRRPQVWLALAIVTFGLGGGFACLSYVTPMLTDVAGFEATTVTMLLSLAGLGMTVGNYLGGRLADRAPMPALAGALLGLAAVLTLFSATVHSKIGATITIFLVGVAAFMVSPIMQARVMEKAGGTPSLVSAAVQSAFNIANSIGAYLGGMVIAGGLGLVSPNWVGAVLTVVGLALAGVSAVVERRETAAAAAVADEATALTEEAALLTEAAPTEEPALARP